MEYPVKDQVEYIVAFIAEFAKSHSITTKEAFSYLDKYGAIHTLIEHYGIAHTLSFEDVIETFTGYCKRNGGTLNETLSRN
jgi:hypothetical protein